MSVASSRALACVRSVLAALPLLALPVAAFAQGHAGGVKVGTTGIGLEYALSLLPQYGVRANLNLGSYTRDETISGFEADGKIGFRSLMLLADAHPYRNGFRLSVGLMINGNTAEATALPVDPVVSINGRDYPAAAVDRVRGEVTFQRLSPYFGVGWGAAPLAGPGAFFSFDLGVMYQRPSGTLSVTCGPAATALQCSQLQADIAAEQRELNEDLVDAKMWPVLTLGFGYRF